MLIVVDDESRENEGDLVMAAEKVTPEAINFIVKYGKEAVDAKISECKASLNLKKKDISSREFLASYRIQQLPRNKMDHFREESN